MYPIHTTLKYKHFHSPNAPDSENGIPIPVTRCCSRVCAARAVRCSSCVLLSSSALLKLRCSSRVCAAPAVRCSNCAAPAKINLFALPHLSSVNFECLGVNARRVDLKFCGAQLCAVRKQDTPPRARAREARSKLEKSKLFTSLPCQGENFGIPTSVPPPPPPLQF